MYNLQAEHAGSIQARIIINQGEVADMGTKDILSKVGICYRATNLLNMYVRSVSLFATGRSESSLSPTTGTQKFLGEITVDVGRIFHVGKMNPMCPVVSRYL